jgi:hypothetical protein
MSIHHPQEYIPLHEKKVLPERNSSHPTPKRYRTNCKSQYYEKESTGNFLTYPRRIASLPCPCTAATIASEGCETLKLFPPVHEMPGTMTATTRDDSWLSASSSQSNILPMIPLCFKFCNLVLELLETLHLSLTRLTSCKSIARSLHCDSVVWIFNDDGWEGLVALSRVKARDRCVSASR